MKKILFLISIIGLAASCAKTRPTEAVPDTNEYRFEKATFTNTDTWLVKETVIASDTLGGFGFIGLQSNLMAGKFEFSKDKLRFIRATSFDGTPSNLDSTIYSWTVEHSEYRLAESGGKVSNRQEENNYLEWNKKRYFKTDFSEADMTLIDTQNDVCFKNVSKNIVPETQSFGADRLTFDVDYTFELKDECWLEYLRRSMSDQTTHTVRIRYSFMPAVNDTSYQPYRYSGDTDPLFEKYGYFTTVVEKKRADDRLENVFLMNRWHPEKEHTIYFAPGFPQDYKWIYAHPEFGVMARTNQVLAKQGIKMRFKIEDAPKGVEFGDLGYSFVKFVEESSAGAPFGYGPSDANPMTGEIIGANSIIWTSGLKFYLERIRANFVSEDARSSSDLFKKMADTFGSSRPEWTKTAIPLQSAETASGKRQFVSDSGRIFHDLLPQYTYAPYSLYSLPLGRAADSEKLKISQDILKKLDLYSGLMPHATAPEQFQALGSGSFDLDQQKYLTSRNHDRFEVNASLNAMTMATKEIYATEERKAQNLLFKNVANANTIHYLDEEQQGLGGIEKFRGMSDVQVSDSILYRVAIHEFGHNLNLRHNFMGSVDAHNFDPEQDIIDRNGKVIMGADGKPLRSEINASSVMDYLDLKDEIKEIFNWGSYDIAALTFAYSGGKTDLGKLNKTVYLYCTDEHRTLNAMCNVYDTGSTASEVAMSLIENYDNSYEITNKRYERAYWSSLGYSSSRFATMMQLRKFLPFAFQTFDSTLDTELSSFDFDSAKREAIRRDIKLDQYQAGTLVAAFYDAVIQQSRAERPFLDDVTKDGSLRTIGIGPDKLYAAYFLFGAPEITYSVKSYAYPYSFLSLRKVSNVMEKIFRRNLTEQPDAYQGFIGFGRMMYADTVMNYLYSSDYELRDRSDIKCVSSSKMSSFLKSDFSLRDFPAFDASDNIRTDDQGLTVTSRLKAVNLTEKRKSLAFNDEALKTRFFRQSGNIAIVEFAGNYLITSSATNPFTFDMLSGIARDWSSGYAVEADTSYVFDFYKYLRSLEGRTVLDCNDNIE